MEQQYDPDDRVDHGGPVAPYKQLAGILAARIARGDWEPNRAIPAEMRLAQEYGVARSTARRSIALLVKQDLLFVVPQRGTFVKPKS